MTRAAARTVAKEDTKACELCNKVFVRHPSLDDRQWDAVRFCSKSCGSRNWWAKPGEERACSVCGAHFNAKIKSQKHCSAKCGWIAYSARATSDPKRKKARSLGGSIRLENKSAILSKMLDAALDKPCRYCGEMLTIGKASLDHIEPMRGLHGAKGAIRRHMDVASNLQIICRRCNMAKSDMNHSDFSALLTFLKANPSIYRAVWPRLRQSGHGWSWLKGISRKEKAERKKLA